MKASLQHLTQEKDVRSFRCYWVRDSQFHFFWHFHPEFEITYVFNGKGSRLVGDNTSGFQNDDLVFLGSNLPHTWISDDEFNQREEQMEVVVVQFSDNIFPGQFLGLPEMSGIKKLLESSGRGLHFPPSIVNRVKTDLMELPELNGFEQLNRLLKVLHILGEAGAAKPVASPYFVPQLGRITEQRIVKVCQHIHNNYLNQIDLAEVAAIANMNQTAFCRFFRKMTGQTLLTYVNDLRIGKACNQLIEDQKNISEIAYASGFNSLTHFNRSFLKRKGLTPKQYRSKFR